MIIIADNRIPEQAKVALENYGEILYLESHGITYPAIAGHPDIFFCQVNEQLVVAPNTPVPLKEYLTKKSVLFINGKSEVGEKYPQTAPYNAVVSVKFIIHNQNFTDSKIKELTAGKEFIYVNQAYTRCNLIALNNDRFITSDRGIEKVLIRKGFKVLYVNPKGIILHGFENGFIGGTCGIFENKIFFTGNLNHFSEGNKIQKFISDYEIIELYNGPLYDGGSLIFIE